MCHQVQLSPAASHSPTAVLDPAGRAALTATSSRSARSVQCSTSSSRSIAAHHAPALDNPGQIRKLTVAASTYKKVPVMTGGGTFRTTAGVLPEAAADGARHRTP